MAPTTMGTTATAPVLGTSPFRRLARRALLIDLVERCINGFSVFLGQLARSNIGCNPAFKRITNSGFIGWTAPDCLNFFQCNLGITEDQSCFLG
jgi:hypothetical protein